jgi:serine/threonine protein kinase
MSPAALPTQALVAMHGGEVCTADTPYDMWQLGMLLYEAASGVPYWGGLTDAAIGAVACAPDEPLPHERSPVTDAQLQAVLSSLLARDPLDRLSAKGARSMLELLL